MWTCQIDKWNPKHSDLSKFFIEKILQLVDFEEIISNRHRTANGFIYVEEISKVCKVALKRSKNANRLKPILEEATLPRIENNLSNDIIINDHFSHITTFYKENLQNIKNKTNKDSSEDLNKIVNSIYLKSGTFQIALEKNYYKHLKFALRNINLQSEEFDRESKKLIKLINCLIPYLLHKGYTLSRIRKEAKSRVNSEEESCIISFLKAFEFTTEKFQFLISISKDHSVLNYEKNLEANNILHFEPYQNSENDQFSIAGNEIFNIDYVKNRDNYLFNANGIDQYSIIRNLFVRSLKNKLIKNYVISFQSFNDYFENIYYRGIDQKFYKPNFSLDPIDVNSRRSTLLNTLNKFNPNIQELPIIEPLSEPIYYYNMALGSKSLENSLLLLWSSLEALIPYNYHTNDITNIQYFVAKFLSVGSIGRSIYAFINRFYKLNSNNNKFLDVLGTEGFGEGITSVSLHNWFIWLMKDFKDNQQDPFHLLKSSPLLCLEYRKFNEEWSKGTLETFLKRVESSNENIKYQLDRIYLHRNQIAHSAIFLNEYSNLWSHLEWYVGKILSYCVMTQMESSEVLEVKKIFQKLESECDEIINYLEINKDKPIEKLDKINFLELFSQTWQYF